jgi:hypothetical protein
MTTAVRGVLTLCPSTCREWAARALLETSAEKVAKAHNLVGHVHVAETSCLQSCSAVVFGGRTFLQSVRHLRFRSDELALRAHSGVRILTSCALTWTGGWPTWLVSTVSVASRLSPCLSPLRSVRCTLTRGVALALLASAWVPVRRRSQRLVPCWVPVCLARRLGLSQ